MITVNTIFSQISDNLPDNKYGIKKKDISDDNTFENIINEAIDNSTDISSSIDAALRLTAQNLKISYNSLVERFSTNGDYKENAKSFLYGVALASSMLNTNNQMNIILDETNYETSNAVNYPTTLYTTGMNQLNNINYGIGNNIDYSSIPL